MILRRAGQGWEFVTEEALEDFVWTNIKLLFGLTPLKRQYFVKGEICDILALDGRQLVVLELKNSEDRYVVQQLTRYYDSLIEEKPFVEEIDYDKFVRLIAVSPIFHKHNYIDRKYNKLELEFLQFKVLKEEQNFYLKLSNNNEKQVSKLEIPYREIEPAIIGGGIATPPSMLLEWLGTYNSEQQEAVLTIRKQILSFDQRIEEMTESKSIKYGRGKTKLCAEFCFQRKLREIVLFLWLYIPNYRKRQAVGRMQIRTSDWSVYLDFAHVPKGISKMELGRIKLYYLVEEGKHVRGYLDELVDEALETWIRRL